MRDEGLSGEVSFFYDFHRNADSDTSLLGLFYYLSLLVLEGGGKDDSASHLLGWKIYVQGVLMSYGFKSIGFRKDAVRYYRKVISENVGEEENIFNPDLICFDDVSLLNAAKSLKLKFFAKDYKDAKGAFPLLLRELEATISDYEINEQGQPDSLVSLFKCQRQTEDAELLFLSLVYLFRCSLFLEDESRWSLQYLVQKHLIKVGLGVMDWQSGIMAHPMGKEVL